MPNRLTKGKALVGAVDADVLTVDTFKIGGSAVTASATTQNQIDDAFGTVDFDRAYKIARVALGTVATPGGVASWANPEGGTILIGQVMVDVQVVATGACTLDIGVTATSGTTLNDTLIDGLDVNAATGVFDNITDKGTNGKSRQRLASGKWVTASVASGTVTGLSGYLYIPYVNV